MNKEPKFQIGQIVKMRWFVPAVFIEGCKVSILEITNRRMSGWRYKVERVDTKEQGWIDEGALVEPLEIGD